MKRDGKNLYIDGEWRVGGNTRAFDIVNPANETTIGELSLSDHSDLNDAVSAAQKGFLEWRDVSPQERGRVLKNIAASLTDRKRELATVMTQEQGKPLAEAIGEMDRTIETFEWCGEEATRTYGRVYPQRATGMRQVTIKQPIGPVAAFSPWNFPAVLSARKIAPALAAGCSIVIKPAEETPGVCIGMFEALEEAGVPPGVANLVFGEPEKVSKHLLSASEIKKVSLTGSTAVGRDLMRLSADGLMNATMELGGHAPVLVFNDTDAEKAAEMTAIFKYRNAGQVCLAPSRVYVHKDVMDKFVRRYVEISRDFLVGDGLDPASQMGPLANERRMAATLRLVEDAKDNGGKIVCGGDRVGNTGYFVAPTVVVDVAANADVMMTEPFGPILAISEFTDFDQAISLANASPFGLAAYAFTESVATATAFADRIDAGWIGINNFSPFLADVAGGGMKKSGIGYEGGTEGMDAYFHTKFVSQTSLAPIVT